jgi:bifunctional UDP-N-acetylglucosamine pyrophosphorylase/glucosamine-1-phosphate N-acetyltransferase
MTEARALVLAAGMGTRMKSDRPKVLFEAGGLPLLWYPLQAAREAGATGTVVVVGAGRELVQGEFADAGLDWAVQSEQRGTGHAVMCAREALAGFDGFVLVLCGDSPLVRAETLRQLIDEAESTGASCVMLTSIVEEPTGYGRIVRGAAGVQRIVEEKCATPEEKKICEVNSGTYCFRWGDLAEVLDRLSDDNAQGEYLLTDAIALLADDSKRLGAVVSKDADEGLGVNTRGQLAAAAKKLRLRVCERLMAEGVTIVDPDTAFIDPRAEIGVDTVINPFVVISGAVKIGGGCRIGPFTHVRGDSRLADGVSLGNFVEVTRSTIGKESRARHLAYVGDATVGDDVNIAAGVITANSDGKTSHATEIGDGASIGAGTVLIAPCRVDDGGATGSGAIVTRNAKVPSGEVWVGVPARALDRGGKNDG